MQLRSRKGLPNLGATFRSDQLFLKKKKKKHKPNKQKSLSPYKSSATSTDLKLKVNLFSLSWPHKSQIQTPSPEDRQSQSLWIQTNLPTVSQRRSLTQRKRDISFQQALLVSTNERWRTAWLRSACFIGTFAPRVDKKHLIGFRKRLVSATLLEHNTFTAVIDLLLERACRGDTHHSWPSGRVNTV